MNVSKSYRAVHQDVSRTVHKENRSVDGQWRASRLETVPRWQGAQTRHYPHAGRADDLKSQLPVDTLSICRVARVGARSNLKRDNDLVHVLTN